MWNPSKLSPVPQCDENEIALKSFFLGPQAENSPWVNPLLNHVLERWEIWRRSLFPKDGKAISELDQSSPRFIARRKNIESITSELLDRLEKEVPKFSPRYAGHMSSEASLPALIGHLIALLHNPNNISGEASRIGTELESEAVLFLRSMIGYPTEDFIGHFTSGGTIANFEALLRAQSRFSLWLSSHALLASLGKIPEFDLFRAAHMGWAEFDLSIEKIMAENINPKELEEWKYGVANPVQFSRRLSSLSNEMDFLGPVVLVPEHMHYSWKKGCKMLGIGGEALWTIPLTAQGHLSTEHLSLLLARAAKKKRPVMMVVSVAGTTELGTIDPVDKVQRILDQFQRSEGIHIWHHVDAAYGGFFKTLDLDRTTLLSDQVKKSLCAISLANSVTLDPHKLGYVPYASGAFLARDPRDYYFSQFEKAPYLDFETTKDRGPYTLEGSRSAAGAIATWMSAKTMGFGPNGYGLLLERTIRICRKLEERLRKSGLEIQIAPGCDTNILAFTCARPGESLLKSNHRTIQVYEEFSPRKNGDFIVSKTTLNWEAYSTYLTEWTHQWSTKRDTNEVALIRMTLMNPFFSSREMNVDFEDLFVQELAKVLQGING